MSNGIFESTSSTIITILIIAGIITVIVLYIRSRLNKIKPPAHIEPVDTHTQNASVLQLPITANVNEIKRQIYNALPDPLASETKRISSAKVLTAETKTAKEWVNVLVSPFKPGKWIDGFRRVEKPFKSAKKCRNPFKKKCWKKWTKVVEEPIKVWVEPVQAVYKSVLSEVANVFDKAFDIDIDVQYEVTLKNLDIVCIKQDISVSVDYKISLSVQYKQNAIPLSSTLKIKGELDGNVQGNISINGNIAIGQNAELIVSLPDDAVQIKLTKTKLPTAIEKVDFLDLIDKAIKPVNKTVLKLVSNQVTKSFQEKLIDSKDDLILGKAIQSFLKENPEPIELADNFWLKPNPKKLAISQINGIQENGANIVSVSIGIEAEPNLVISNKAPKKSPAGPVSIVTEEMQSLFYLYPAIKLEYKFTSDKIKTELRKFIDDKFDKFPYTSGNVDIYPSNDKLVVAVDLIKRSNNKKLVSFYLWGRPKLDAPNNRVSLEDFDFTLETRQYILKIAEWLLGDKIKEFIQDKAVFEYATQLATITDKLTNFKAEIEYGTLTGQLGEFRPDALFTAKRYLTVYLLASGSASFTLQDNGPGIKLNGQVISSKDTEVQSIPTPAITENDSTDEDEQHAIAPAYVNVGDRIYFKDRLGRTRSRRAGPKDATLPGETVLISDQNGKIKSVRFE